MMKKFTFLVLALVIFINSYAIDTLNVNITNDTTLTADTIFVAHGIVIDTGITLTIDPGVTMLFNGDVTYDVASSTQAGYLLVNGTIIAEGTPDNRITFTKNASLEWGGIFLSDTADYSSFKYCNFSYGYQIDNLNGNLYDGTLVLLNDSNDIFSCQFSYNTNACLISSSDATIFNCIFDNNDYSIYADNSNIFVGNTTIADNTNGVFLENTANATITNSIIYSNTNAQLDGTGSFSYDVTYSDIEGYYTGTGNYAIDPSFQNNINFKLNPCSEIIDKGNSDTSGLLDNIDFFGNARTFVITDMGAYEHQYTNSITSTDTTNHYMCNGDSILIDGIYFYSDTIFAKTITGISDNYCDSTYIISVQINNTPVVVFNPNDTTVCKGSYTPIYTSIDPIFTNQTYQWNTSDTSETLIPLGQTGVLGVFDKEKTYYVTVTSDSGCVYMDSTNIQLFPFINITIGNDTTVCRKYVISAGAGYSEYKWNTYETTESIEALDDMIYTVTVTDSYTCTEEASIDITLLASPVVEFYEDTLKMTTDDTRIVGGAGLNYPNYLWNTGATTQTITLIGMDLGIGTYTYWQYAEFSSTGCSASDTIIIVVTDGVGINDIDGLNNISLYPNPSNGILFLNANFDEIGDISINITDISGRIVLSRDITGTNIINEQIDLTNNNKGIYFVNLVYNNQVVSYKISIQ